MLGRLGTAGQAYLQVSGISWDREMPGQDVEHGQVWLGGPSANHGRAVGSWTPALVLLLGRVGEPQGARQGSRNNRLTPPWLLLSFLTCIPLDASPFSHSSLAQKKFCFPQNVISVADYHQPLKWLKCLNRHQQELETWN